MYKTTDLLAAGNISAPNPLFPQCRVWSCTPATSWVFRASSVHPCSYKTGVKQLQVSQSLVPSWLDLGLHIPLLLQTGTDIQVTASAALLKLIEIL